MNKRFISYVQIFILVVATFAFAYLVKESAGLVDENVVYNDGDSKLIDVMKFVEKQIDLIPSVSAQEEFLPEGFIFEEDTNATNYAAASESISRVGWNCCPRTKIGAICQNLGPTLQDDCAVDTIPTNCNQVIECQVGTCIDPVEGLCSTGAPKAQCELDGGSWKENPNTLIPECTKGCCVLGSDVEFVNGNRCEYLSLQQGFSLDYRPEVRTEIGCLAVKETQEFGACVIQGSCRQLTELVCAEANGDFYSGKLCSDESLGTGCQKQASVSCVEGEDEIYWFDSCGNRENIYSSDKEASWNDGNILSKEESCNPTENNANSKDCGNCNYLIGSSCSESKLGGTSVKDGSYICRDLSCEDENGNRRENGESWCVYDSKIGDGKDAVGSRHWKRNCIDGEIKVDGCADYRGQICVQSEIENDDGEKFSSAACIVNDAVKCVDYNKDKKTMKKNCLANEQCEITKVDVDKFFKFEMCTAKYPRGFDLTDGENVAASSSDLCGLANQKCTVIYEKKLSGSWKCIANCDCEEKKFAEEMNNLCIALGDCGSYVNFEGEGTDNIRVKNSPKVSWTKYVKYATPVEGEFAEITKIDEELLAGIGGGNSKDVTKPNYVPEADKITKALTVLGSVSGATGYAIVGASWAFGATTVYESGAIIESSGALIGTGTVPAWVGTFGHVIAGLAIGATVGVIAAKVFGLQGDAATIVIAAGAIAGGLGGFAGASAAGGATGGLASLPFAALGPLFASLIWAAIVVIVLAIVLKLLGVGKTKKVVVKFSCLPWQAPVGSSDCEKCHEDPLKPCSEYRCSALGQACQLENENTENPICIGTANDGKPPVITPGLIQAGYEFVNEEQFKVEVKKENGECIQEFTPVQFSLETDEFAQCKWDFERDEKYDEMEEDFIQTSYVINHSMVFSMPSLEALEAEYNLTFDGDIREKFGNFNMFVKCQDTYGNTNTRDYAVDICIKSGVDTTPVEFVRTIPPNGATVAFNTAQIPAKFYLNEPAECKYDVVPNKNYDEMLRTMECETGLADASLYGWECRTTLTDLKNEDNEFYVKCKDQPWFKDTANESNRNVNNQDYEYILHGSESELSIVSVSPNDVTIEEGTEPISVDLEVETSGGVENGKAECYYSFKELSDNMIRFKETHSSEHKQVFDLMSAGDYNIFIKCQDGAKNTATTEAVFTLALDTTAPTVTRVYNLGSELVVHTTEDAECFYSTERCGFNIGNGTAMTSVGFDKIHKADWEAGTIYHIKCRDIWGNAPGGCSIKATPSTT